MAFRLRDVSLEEYVKVAGVFLVPIVVGAAARIWYPCNWWPHDTTYALADALIVAGVIGLLLELYAAKFLIEKVSDHLAERLIGRGLPEELQGHIGQIVKTDIVRDNYVKTYDFNDPANGQVRIEITITFEVRNYSDASTEFKPTMDEEAMFRPEFIYLEYGIKGESPRSLNVKDLEKTITLNPKTNVKTAGADQAISLAAIRTHPKEVCNVKWMYAVTMPEEFSDVTAFRAATIGAKLCLGRIPDALIFVSSGEGMVPHTEGSRTWEYKGPYIGGQHVRTWWFRKQTA
jgi:hypothetical protein